MQCEVAKHDEDGIAIVLAVFGTPLPILGGQSFEVFDQISAVARKASFLHVGPSSATSRLLPRSPENRV